MAKANEVLEALDAGVERNAYLEGRAKMKGITESDVNADELARGIEHEMEHTTDRDTAARIALDHLAEYAGYYTALDKMEGELYRERLKREAEVEE